MDSDYYFGIDIGGTKLRVALVNNKMEIENMIINREHYLLSPEKLLDLLVKMIDQLSEDIDGAQIKGVGIGFPGPINQQTKSPFSYTNLFNGKWGSLPLGDMIEEKLKIPVFLDNDANLAGMAEMLMGAGKDYSDAVYITISTGIGGAIFINNELYRGFQGRAGEVGHMIVNIDGAECKCGNKGCFMGEFSGLALERLLAGDPDFLVALGIPGKPRAGIKVLFDRARAGEQKALQVVRSFTRVIAVSMSNIIQILNPELIIIGGGIGQSFKDLYQEDVHSHFKKLLPAEVANNIIFKEAELGDINGIIGAALMAKKGLQ